MITAERWGEIDAHYHAAPQPLLRMRLARLISFVYVWCIERVPHDKIDEWEADLVDLLPWQDSSTEAAANAESEAFMASYNRQK